MNWDTVVGILFLVLGGWAGVCAILLKLHKREPGGWCGRSPASNLLLGVGCLANSVGSFGHSMLSDIVASQLSIGASLVFVFTLLLSMRAK